MNRADSHLWMADPATSPWGCFWEGLQTPWWGFWYLWRRPSLWRYAVMPIVMNLLITSLVLLVLVGGGVWLFAWIHPWFAGGEGWTGWIWFAVEAGVWLLAAAASCVAAFLTWRVLSGILCGYFFGKLVEEVESELGLADRDIRTVSLGYEIWDVGLGVALLLGSTSGFLLLGAVPLIGPPLGFLGMSWYGLYATGVEYLSYPQAIRGSRLFDQYRFGRQQHFHTLGVGAVQTAGQLLPLFGAATVTAGVVGCVLLHRRLTNKLSIVSVEAIAKS
ncbi:EI24 domain-containing protein [Lignipirellula cremea]|uniref:Putative sulfate transport protein CysZ n=1 Tax=Lignipirellula cremea TaxID=2528010 RepID=A0A518DS94_9BACT|nr:EI24 domain-containing protein [Lignipirellula cremea]QDU94716.1 putative sulfate transport protein CysZ [Lignipirellula cremea]